MNVPSRNTTFAGIALGALMSLGGTAIADQCGTGCGAGPVVPGPVFVGAPGVTPGTATTSSGSSACCGAGRSVNVQVPGVTIAGPDIVVGAPNVSVGRMEQSYSSLETQSFLMRQERQQFMMGGSGAWTVEEPAAATSTTFQETERYTETVTEQVPVTEEICRDEISSTVAFRPVQAVCLDDKGAPHPASRLDNSKSVAGTFSGEVFRCMAGTQMQVTMGRLDGNQISFDRGETFSCQKGEALVHKPGGRLVCAPQTPQRNCNERSLLRRYGPGVKLVQTRAMTRVCTPQTTYQQVSRKVEKERPLPPRRMILNGGVGNTAY
ncbi:MAG: hypothetical protein R3C13_07860 [Hyphomonas sp.]|uniref:hypothetical protein n=1 Tax=Hyphomonas sp. TaxID=87 RepID=UPI003527FD8E